MARMTYLVLGLIPSNYESLHGIKLQNAHFSVLFQGTILGGQQR